MFLRSATLSRAGPLVRGGRQSRSVSMADALWRRLQQDQDAFKPIKAGGPALAAILIMTCIPLCFRKRTIRIAQRLCAGRREEGGAPAPQPTRRQYRRRPVAGPSQGSGDADPEEANAAPGGSDSNLDQQAHRYFGIPVVPPPPHLNPRVRAAVEAHNRARRNAMAAIGLSGQGSGPSSDPQEDVCVICLCGFQEPDYCAALPCALHRLHWQCWVHWRRRVAQCPVCRTPAPPSDVVKVRWYPSLGIEQELRRGRSRERNARDVPDGSQTPTITSERSEGSLVGSMPARLDHAVTSADFGSEISSEVTRSTSSARVVQRASSAPAGSGLVARRTNETTDWRRGSGPRRAARRHEETRGVSAGAAGRHEAGSTPTAATIQRLQTIQRRARSRGADGTGSQTSLDGAAPRTGNDGTSSRTVNDGTSSRTGNHGSSSRPAKHGSGSRAANTGSSSRSSADGTGSRTLRPTSDVVDTQIAQV